MISLAVAVLAKETLRTAFQAPGNASALADTQEMLDLICFLLTQSSLAQILSRSSEESNFWEKDVQTALDKVG